MVEKKKEKIFNLLIILFYTKLCDWKLEKMMKFNGDQTGAKHH